MHLESHKIFEAYVLAKSVERKPLNEGIMDFLKGIPKRSEDKKRYETYKDLWTRFWYPRFAKKGDIKTNKEKAVDTFNKFLNSRAWADANMQENKAKALEYFKTNHTAQKYEDAEKGALETLLYGQTSLYTPAKEETPSETPSETPASVTSSKPADSVEQAKAEPELKTMNPAEYAKLSPEEKQKLHGDVYAKKETVAPTPEPVADETSAEPSTEELPQDPYKLKAEITRLKNLNKTWSKAISKKLGRNVTKPSQLLVRKK